MHMHWNCRTITLAAAIFAVLLPLLLHAAERSATSIASTESLDTVTVEANRKRLQERVDSFVSAISVHATDDSLARWEVPICLLVAGLTQNSGEVVFNRILHAARDANVPIDA